MAYKHGACNTRLYRIWTNLKHRVLPTSDKSKYYYDKGIILCDEWKNSFVVFRDWAINNGYRDDLSLDRINNDGNYEPSNCRWTTMKEQCNNRSNNIKIFIDETELTFAQVCRFLGLDYEDSYNKIIKRHVIKKEQNK